MKKLSILTFTLMILLPVITTAEIKVSDKSGVFLGYLVGNDLNHDAGWTLRLFLPKSNNFVAYTYVVPTSLNLLDATLFFSEEDCRGVAHVSAMGTVFNDIRRSKASSLLFVGRGDELIYLTYRSRAVGILCYNEVNVIWVMEAESVPEGAVPLSLGLDRLPLKFEWEESRGRTTYLTIPVSTVP